MLRRLVHRRAGASWRRESNWGSRWEAIQNSGVQSGMCCSVSVGRKRGRAVKNTQVHISLIFIITKHDTGGARYWPLAQVSTLSNTTHCCELRCSHERCCEQRCTVNRAAVACWLVWTALPCHARCCEPRSCDTEHAVLIVSSPSPAPARLITQIPTPLSLLCSAFPFI